MAFQWVSELEAKRKSHLQRFHLLLGIIKYGWDGRQSSKLYGKANWTWSNYNHSNYMWDKTNNIKWGVCHTNEMLLQHPKVKCSFQCYNHSLKNSYRSKFWALATYLWHHDVMWQSGSHSLAHIEHSWAVVAIFGECWLARLPNICNDELLL